LARETPIATAASAGAPFDSYPLRRSSRYQVLQVRAPTIFCTADVGVEFIGADSFGMLLSGAQSPHAIEGGQSAEEAVA
jgi:hypothetical protein